MEEDYLEEIIWTCLASAVAGLCVAAVKRQNKQQAPALELPIVPSKPDHSKKAILVVSFGTSYEETREKTIGAIEEDFRRAFPDFEVRRAFTSGMIIRKLKSATASKSIRSNRHCKNCLTKDLAPLSVSRPM